MRWSRSPWLRRAGIAVAALAAFGHWSCAYRARPLAKAPDATDAPFELFATSAWPLAVWLPRPHQNLGSLAGFGLPPEALFASGAVLFGDGDATLPRFGPFKLPPAKEVAVVADPATGAFVAVARVYPAFAMIARAGGFLARNPWLAGGTVEHRGDRVEVSWRGTLWTARTRTTAAPGPEAMRLEAAAIGRALGALRVGRGFAPLPTGVYRLSLEADGVRLSRRPAGTPAPEPPPLLARFGRDGTSFGLLRRAGQPERWFFLFAPNGATTPRFALVSGGAAPERFAGVGLGALLGREGHAGTADGWNLLAGRAEDYARALAMVPELAAAGAEPSSAAALGAAFAGEPGQVLEALEQATSRLEGLGHAPAAEGGGFAAVVRLLRPLRSCGRAAFWVSRDGTVVELWLVPRA